MTPEAAEVAALKDKLVKMELDHIAVTTSNEKEYVCRLWAADPVTYGLVWKSVLDVFLWLFRSRVAQMTSVLEHRAEGHPQAERDPEENAQDDEQSCKTLSIDAHSSPSVTTHCFWDQNVSPVRFAWIQWESVFMKGGVLQG